MEQGDFRYLKRLLQGDSLVVEVDDVAGSTDVFVSTTEKNPGPFANEYKDVTGLDRKVIRTTKNANQVYIALQGRGAGTATARVNIYSNLYPSVDVASVSIGEGLAGDTFIYQMPSATLGAGISQSSLTYSLSNSMRGGGALPFAVDRKSGRVTTTGPILAATATTWYFDVVATPASSTQCVRGQVPVVVTIIPKTTTSTTSTLTRDVTICTAGQQAKCGTNTCKGTGEEAGSSNSNDVKCTDPNDPTLEVCTEADQAKCKQEACVIESNDQYRRPPYCAVSTKSSTTAPTTRPVGATVPEPITATTTAPITTTTPDVTLCTPGQQVKCGTNTCTPTGKPEGASGGNDVKCTDPNDPTVEVCTEDQDAKCGDTECVVATDGTAPPCAGPPDLEVCTEAQQAKCGTSTCQAATGGAGTKCTDPGDPDVEVCTVQQQARCKDTKCVVSEAGIPSSCAGPPDLEVCTPGQQVKCGANDCQPSGSSSSRGVKCTKPGNPDVEVCTADQQTRCGAIPCVVGDNGEVVSKCAGPPPPPVPPGLTFVVDPQSDTGKSICRNVRVPCEGMTPTVYVVVEAAEAGQAVNITVQSSFQGGVISAVEDTVSRDYGAASRKLITYAPGIEFDQLHLTLCGRIFTVQVLLDLLVNDGPIITGCVNAAPVLPSPIVFPAPPHSIVAHSIYFIPEWRKCKCIPTTAACKRWVA